jgi:hypothetical protein
MVKRTLDMGGGGREEIWVEIDSLFGRKLQHKLISSGQTYFGRPSIFFVIKTHALVVYTLDI